MNLLRLLPFLFNSLWLIAIFVFSPHYIYLYNIMCEWFVTKGLLWFRDIETYNLPLASLLSLGILFLTNWNFEIEPYLALLIGIANLFLIYFIGKKYLNALGQITALTFFSLFFWYSATGILYFHEILISLFITINIYLTLSLHQQKQASYKYLALAGFFLFLTEFSGQISTISNITLISANIYLLLKHKANQLTKIKQVGVFLASLMLPFLFVLGFFLLNHGLSDFFNFNVLYYIQYANFDKDMGRNLNELPILQLFFYYYPLILLTILLLITKFQKLKTKFVDMFMLSLAVSSIPFIIFSIYHPHHLNYALPILALTLGFSFNLASKIKWFKNIYSILVCILLLFFFIKIIIPWHISKFIFPPSNKIYNDLPAFPDNPIDQAELNTIIWLKENTKPEERIIVFGDPLVYLKSNRLPSIEQPIGLPHSWLPLKKIAQAVTSNPPDYWIIDQIYIKRMINNYNQQELIDFINQELTKYYKVADFNYWQIWARKEN